MDGDSSMKDYILNFIDNTLTIGNISSNPALYETLRKNNGIPLQALIYMQPLYSKKVILFDVVKAICSSEYWFPHLHDNHKIIRLPYVTDDTHLIIQSNTKNLTKSDIQALVFQMVGHGQNGVNIIHKADDFELGFDSNHNMMAFWRSLSYVSYKGHSFRCNGILKYRAQTKKINNDTKSLIKIEKSNFQKINLQNSSKNFVWFHFYLGHR